MIYLENSRVTRQPVVGVRIWYGYENSYLDPYPGVPYPKPTWVSKPVTIIPKPCSNCTIHLQYPCYIIMESNFFTNLYLPYI